MIKKSSGERNHSDYLPILRSKEVNPQEMLKELTREMAELNEKGKEEK